MAKSWDAVLEDSLDVRHLGINRAESIVIIQAFATLPRSSEYPHLSNASMIKSFVSQQTLQQDLERSP